MAKKSNRETIEMGHPVNPRPRVVTAPAGIAAARQEDRKRFAELIDSETAAANAHADKADAILAGGLYTGSADPGSVVGLDGFTPTVDTPVDGDTKRTDPDPS